MSIKQGGKVIAGNVSHYNTGDTFLTKRTDTNLAGAVECDGATYNTTDFTGNGSIGELLEAGKLDYVSLSAYSTAISTKGWCDKIGWDGTGNTVFRVPTLTPRIIQTNNIPVVGNGDYLGVTDKGHLTTRNRIWRPDSSTNATYIDVPGTGYDNGAVAITTDPAKSGIIADTTDTAQLRVMIQIANGSTDEALETCTSVLADVAALKYDYVVDFQAPTAQNNYTWYRKYKSGWVEQGGLALNIPWNPNGGQVTVSLPITMRDTNYTAMATLNDSASNWNYPGCRILKFTSGVAVGLATLGNNQGTGNCSWEVKGMAQE